MILQLVRLSASFGLQVFSLLPSVTQTKPNLTLLPLSAGKAFDITYVRLKFHTSRPESFAIYKRTSEGSPWVPYQYYSSSCEKTYQKANRGFIRTGQDEQQALCTDEFSDISPLTGGNVAFSTLEGRPSAYNFDNSPVLQVSAFLLLILPHESLLKALRAETTSAPQKSDVRKSENRNVTRIYRNHVEAQI